MKKTLSVLLAALLLAGLFAPAVFADDEVFAIRKYIQSPTKALNGLNEPVEMYKDGVIYLVLSHPKVAPDMTYDWKLSNSPDPDDESVPPYLFSFRPVQAIGHGAVNLLPSHLHRSTGNDRMELTALEEGIAYIVVREVIFEDDNPNDFKEYGDFVGAIQINVVAPPPERTEPIDNSLQNILRIIWEDLQYFYYYQVRPTVKYAFFAATDWIGYTLGLGCQVVKGWFNAFLGLFAT